MSWISQIASSVLANEVEHRKLWDRHIPEGVQGDQRTKFQNLLRMFDWTVRNIQLSPLLDYPEVAEGEARTAPELGLLYVIFSCLGKEIGGSELVFLYYWRGRWTYR